LALDFNILYLGKPGQHFFFGLLQIEQKDAFGIEKRDFFSYLALNKFGAIPAADIAGSGHADFPDFERRGKTNQPDAAARHSKNTNRPPKRRLGDQGLVFPGAMGFLVNSASHFKTNFQ